jgi:hypothetical protein
LVTPSTLLYGSFGWQWADFDYRDYYYPDSDYPTANQVANGPQGGAGVEVMLGNGLLARLDATYAFYGTEEILYQSDPFWLTRASELAVQFGLGYHFGGTLPAPASGGSVPFEWAGVYAGLQAGGTATDAFQKLGDFSETWAQYAAASPTAGVFGGVNARFGERFLVGLEGNANIRDIVSEYIGTTYPYLYESRWSAAARLRAGLLVNPDTLVYGSFGWQWADLDLSAYYTAPAYALSADMIDGPQAGGGIEIAVAPHLAVRADATFTWYGGLDIASGGERYSRYTLHELTGMAGIAYHP